MLGDGDLVLAGPGLNNAHAGDVVEDGCEVRICPIVALGVVSSQSF